MDAAAICRTEKEDGEQDIFDCVAFFLAAITRFLFSRVLGADDAPFRPVMGTRGEAGAAAGTGAAGAGSSSSASTTVAASVSETPSRWARAVRNGPGHRRGCGALPAVWAGGRESTDWLCLSPCR